MFKYFQNYNMLGLSCIVFFNFFLVHGLTTSSSLTEVIIQGSYSRNLKNTKSPIYQANKKINFFLVLIVFTPKYFLSIVNIKLLFTLLMFLDSKFNNSG